MKDDLILHSQFILGRYDQYYNNINNKGQFYLGINTLMVGAAISLLPKISKYCSLDGWFYLFVILFSLCCFFAVVFTLLSIHPYLKKGGLPRSMIFFKSISELPCDEFIKKFSTQSKQEIKNDLAHQIHVLASGLTPKFKYLKYASYFLVGEFIFGFIMIILISKNVSL